MGAQWSQTGRGPASASNVIKSSTWAMGLRGTQLICFQHQAHNWAQTHLLCGFSPSLPGPSLGGEDTKFFKFPNCRGCVQHPPASSGASAVLHPLQAHPLDQRYLGRRRSPSITSRSLDRGRIFAFKPNSCKSSVLPINSLIFSSIHSPAPRPKHTEAEQHTKSSPNHCCSYGNSSSSSYSSPIMFSDKTTKYKLI